MHAAIPAPSGALGVHGLERFWLQKTSSRSGVDSLPPTADDLRIEKVLLAGLKLGVRETIDFLVATHPSFADFESWILANNDGTIEPAQVDRLNGALRGDGDFTLESILTESVLSHAELDSWDEHGYVVVRQAVSTAACQAAVEAIFEHSHVSLDQPDTWYKAGLWIPLAHHPALWANRNSPRIHTAFSQIWRRQDLWMNVDVCGVNPPERRGYSFQGTPLHWDMSLAPPVQFGTQAILYLTDTAANQGAFSCVAGFHRRLESWLKDLPADADPRIVAVKELKPTPIAGGAGDLIIWHQALPHGATPNRAELPRVAQYLNMFPSRHEVNTTWV